jgi:hypothetical protein
MLRMNMKLINPQAFVQQNFVSPNRRVLYTWLDAFSTKNIQSNIPDIDLQDVRSKIKNYFPGVSIKKEDHEKDPALIITYNLQEAIRSLGPNNAEQFGDWLDHIFTEVLPEDIDEDMKKQIREEASLCLPETIRAQIKAGLFRSLPA